MNEWISRAVDADAAIATLSSDSRVFVHGAAATPAPLLHARYVGGRRAGRGAPLAF